MNITTTTETRTRVAVLRSRYRAAGKVHIPSLHAIDDLATELFGPDIPVTILLVRSDDLADLKDEIEYMEDNQ